MISTLIFLFAALSVHPCYPKELNLMLLHVSRIRGTFDEINFQNRYCEKRQKCRGGTSRMSALVKEFRGQAGNNSQSPAVLFLVGGSVYPGSIWYATGGVKLATDIVNELNPDAVTISPYEFDPGIEGLSDYVNNIKMPVVVANMDVSKEPVLSKVKKSIVLSLQEHKIGIVGVIGKDTPMHTLHYDKLIFNDEIVEISKECERLHETGVDLIIVLGASTWRTHLEIAKTVPYVNIVVGCEHNIFLYNGEPPQIKKKPLDRYPVVVKRNNKKLVYVVSTMDNALFLGRLNININHHGAISCYGQPIYLDPSLPKDPKIEEILNKYRSAVDAYRTEVIAYTHMTLEGSRRRCFVDECNLGNLVADAFVWKCLQSYKRDENNYWTDTSIALLNSGLMRQSIMSRNGNITRDLVLEALPFDEPIYKAELRGKDLLATFELSAKDYKPRRGYNLQVSGIQVKYDFGRAVGNRVEYLRVRCAQCRVPKYEPIEKDKVYRLALPLFILAGGNDYKLVAEKKNMIGLVDERSVRVVESYMKHLNNIHVVEGDRVVRTNVPKSNSVGNIIVSRCVSVLLPLYIYLVY